MFGRRGPCDSRAMSIHDTTRVNAYGTGFQDSRPAGDVRIARIRFCRTACRDRGSLRRVQTIVRTHARFAPRGFGGSACPRRHRVEIVAPSSNSIVKSRCGHRSAQAAVPEHAGESPDIDEAIHVPEIKHQVFPGQRLPRTKSGVASSESRVGPRGKGSGVCFRPLAPEPDGPRNHRDPDDGTNPQIRRTQQILETVDRQH